MRRQFSIPMAGGSLAKTQEVFLYGGTVYLLSFQTACRTAESSAGVKAS